MRDLAILIKSLKDFSLLVENLHEDISRFRAEFKEDLNIFTEFDKADYSVAMYVFEILTEWVNSERSLHDFDGFVRKINSIDMSAMAQKRILYDAGRTKSEYEDSFDTLRKKILNFNRILDSDFSSNYSTMKQLSEFLLNDPNVNKGGFVKKVKDCSDYVDESYRNVKAKISELDSEFQELIRVKSYIEKQMSAAAEAVTAAATKHIGSTIAAAYRLNAQKENNLADWFRLGSIACFAISASIIFYGFWNNTAAPRSFVELIYRAGPILFFTIPAFYLARESNAHRVVQRKFQHLALNLPIGIKYIRGLDENSRHLIEAEFAKHLLMYSENSLASNNSGSNTVSNDDLNLRNVLSELKVVIEKIPKP